MLRNILPCAICMTPGYVAFRYFTDDVGMFATLTVMVLVFYGGVIFGSEFSND